MRLRDIQQVLAKTVDELRIEARDLGAKNMEIHGSRQALKAIKALEETGLFQEEITKLLSVSVIVNNVSDPIVTPLSPNTPNTCLLYTSPSPRDS